MSTQSDREEQRAPIVEALSRLEPRLDEASLEPDPSRPLASDVAATSLRLDFLREILEPLEAIAKEPDDAPLREHVAALGGEIAVLAALAGKTHEAKELRDRAIALAADGKAAAELAAWASGEPFPELVHARWLLRNRREREADRALANLREKAKSPTMKAGVDDAVASPRPVGAAPALFTMNGFGTSMAGKRDLWPDGSFVSTLVLTALFVPLVPLRAYRVYRDGNSYSFLGKVPLSPFARVMRWMMPTIIAMSVSLFAYVGFIDSEGHRAEVALAEALSQREAGDADGARRQLEALIEAYPGADESTLDAAGSAIVELAAFSVPTPFTRDSLPDAATVAARYRSLPAAARGDRALGALLSALEGWADQLADEGDGPLAARAALLALGADAAGVNDTARWAERAAAAHVALAESWATTWPTDALDAYAYAAASELPMPSLPAALEAVAADASLAHEAAPALRTIIAARPAPSNEAIQGSLTRAQSWQGDSARAAALDTIDVPALTARLAATPDDQAVRVALALDAERRGALPDALARIDAVGAEGLLVRDARLLRARLLVSLDRTEEARTLLRHHVDARLPIFQREDARYAVAYAEEVAAVDARLDRNVVPEDLRARIDAVAEDEQPAVYRAWLAAHLESVPTVRAAREAYEASLDVVSACLALAELELELASREEDADEKKARLDEAEGLFLAIQNEGRGLPRYHIGLGMVYHRLGQPERGEEELGHVLAEADAATKLEVVHAYRALRLEERARTIAEAVYAEADGDLKGQAAVARSLLFRSLDDQIAWLERAPAANPYVQTSLAETRAERAFPGGDYATAASEFARVAGLYREGSSDRRSGLNNGGLALAREYTASGDRHALDEALRLLEEAVRLDPDGVVILQNLASTLEHRAYVEVLGRWARIERLHLTPRLLSRLVDVLSRGPLADELVAALRSSRDLARVREISRRLMVLAPAGFEGPVTEYSIASLTRDESGLRRLVTALKGRAAPGEDAPEPSDALLLEQKTRLDRQLERAAHDVEALGTTRGPLFALGHVVLEELEMQHRSRRVPDVAERVEAHARAAVAAWEAVGPDPLINALLLRAAADELARDASLASVDPDESLGSLYFLLQLARTDEARAARLEADPRLAELVPLMLGLRDHSVRPVAIFELTHTEALAELALAMREDPLVILGARVRAALYPDEPSRPLRASLIGFVPTSGS
jgi:hypothetical protein